MFQKQPRIYNALWWYAVDHDGTAWLHCRQPKQIDGLQYACDAGSYSLLPNEIPDSLQGITFDDGPVPVRLDLRVVRLAKANVPSVIK